MPLTPGARLGPYEIISAIGAGGMGEVYRARDSRLGLDGRMMAVPVTAEGARFDVGAVRPLFDVRAGGPRSFYDVTPDNRFLVNMAPQRSEVSPITLVVNWAAELKQ